MALVTTLRFRVWIAVGCCTVVSSAMASGVIGIPMYPHNSPQPLVREDALVRSELSLHVLPKDSLQDSALTIGTLPNGMRYYIRTNRRPANRAMVWLAVNAGAIQEDDDQRGMAHFLEHMAFNGTTHFPQNSLIDLIERAIEKRDVLTLDYHDEAGRGTARDVRPLGLWFWGKVWTLIAWCEMRNDFRAFRIDRIATVKGSGRTFRPERGKLLADYYRSIERSEAPGADQALRRS